MKTDDPAPVTPPRRWLLLAVFAVMTALIFAQLGHYALWDDEAITALAGKGILRTGDTSVLLDHGNVVAYRAGINIVDFHDRAMPPLGSYLTAASIGLLGVDAWTARLPFALFGVATVALLLWWVRRAEAPFLYVFLFGLVCDVALILFFRQCRYYALSIFFSTLIVYLYWNWKPTRGAMVILSFLSALLFAAHFLNFIALYVCLGVDYLIWRRKEWWPGWSGWLLLFGPQAILNGAVAWIWNPLRTKFADYGAHNTLGDYLTLFYWYWRDMGRAEFLALPVILLALIIGIRQGRTWLVRGVVAIAVYALAMCFMAPQQIHLALEGEVRYLCPLLPLALALQAGVIAILFGSRKGLLATAAVLVFATNLINPSSWLDQGPRSTILSYLGELSLPQAEPYTPAIQWVNDHVAEGQSVWVVPNWPTYPLMLHAPKALYAWQLEWPPRADFAGLPKIQFQGQDYPDFVIVFGPDINGVRPFLAGLKKAGVSYEPADTLNVYWRDKYRPEIFWHNFETVTRFDPDQEAIYIFKKIPAPAVEKGGG